MAEDASQRRRMMKTRHIQEEEENEEEHEEEENDASYERDVVLDQHLQSIYAWTSSHFGWDFEHHRELDPFELSWRIAADAHPFLMTHAHRVVRFFDHHGTSSSSCSSPHSMHGVHSYWPPHGSPVHEYDMMTRMPALPRGRPPLTAYDSRHHDNGLSQQRSLSTTRSVCLATTTHKQYEHLVKTWT
jgi:hypothetical protein